MNVPWRRRPGPEDDFVAFVASRRQQLRNTAYLLCGDWHLAEDLVQTAYQRIFRSWQRVRLVDMPDAYARRVVYRCYLDSRKWQREATSLEALVDRPAVQDDAAVRLTILAALAELAPRTRAVVALRYWEDQSVEQTADALGISTGTVKSMSARGLAQLRERLGDFGSLLPDSVETK